MKKKNLIIAMFIALISISFCVSGCAGKQGDTEKNASTYTVTFVTNGGSSIVPLKVDKGSYCILPAPTREGYVFNGWFENAELTGEGKTGSYLPAADITLYASWLGNTEQDNTFTYTAVVEQDAIAGYKVSSIKELPQDKKIVIPETVKSIPVVEIEESAFADLDCEEVTIPSSVTKIGRKVLSGCNSIKSLTLPFVGNNVLDQSETGVETSFLGYLFGGVSFESNKTSVPESLKSVTITTGTVIFNSMFFGCSSLTSIVLPSTLTEIEYDAFGDCSMLNTIIIPEGVVNIGMYAFQNCTALTEIAIPNSVEIIDDRAFMNCAALETVQLGTGLKTINNRAFYNCSALTEITIPEGVTVIEELFGECRALKSVVLPSTVTEIEANSFNNCTALETINIPDNVATLESNTFSGCSRLYSVTLPNKLTKIDQIAFNECHSLLSIELPATLTTIEDNAFNDCYKLIEVKNLSALEIVAGSQTNGSVSLYAKNVYKTGDSKIKIDNKGFAFYVDGGSCYLVDYQGNDQEIVLPTQYTTFTTYKVYDNAFAYKNITKAAVMPSVTELGENAFAHCANLTSVTVSKEAVTLGKNVFADCAALKTIWFEIAAAPNTFNAEWKGDSKCQVHFNRGVDWDYVNGIPELLKK